MKKAVLALLLVPVVLMASATAEDEAEYKRWTLDIEYVAPPAEGHHGLVPGLVPDDQAHQQHGR